VATSSSLVESSGAPPLAYALLKLMGGLKLSRDWSWELMVQHRREVFRSVVTPLQPLRFVPYDSVDAGHADVSTFPRVSRPIDSVTAFESTSVGALVDLGKASAYYSHGFVGLAYTRYQKPYMLRYGDSVLPDYLFDGHFSAFGVELGGFRNEDPTNGGLLYDIRAQISAGKVELTRDLDLGKLVDSTRNGIGFLQGHIGVGYLFRLVRASWSLAAGVHAEATANYFFAYSKSSDAQSGRDSSVTLNYDILFGGDGRVVVGF
jgi:hypothetical protein